MIREVLILNKTGGKVFHKAYTKSKEISVDAILPTILGASERMEMGNIEHTNIVRFRFSYLKSNGNIFAILSDRTNSEREVQDILLEITTSFIKKFGPENQTENSSKLGDGFDSVVIDIISKLPVKLSLVGFGGVGKTTILRLLRKEEIPMKYVPTIFADREPLTVTVGVYYVMIFDFAGQEQFMSAWDILVKGTEVIAIICDSTLDNIKLTREKILPLVKSKAPYAKIIGVANKQDRGNALPPEEIEKILGIKTYGLVAIEKSQRNNLLELLERIILE
ncbi:MAG: ADP-ribosylation factor-like protein [Candidatus Hodarchaeota archaeon]